MFEHKKEEEEKNGPWNTSRCWSKREHSAHEQAQLRGFYAGFYCLEHMLSTQRS